MSRSRNKNNWIRDKPRNSKKKNIWVRPYRRVVKSKLKHFVSENLESLEELELPTRDEIVNFYDVEDYKYEGDETNRK